MSASRLDAVYRSILITKFFTKGWGKPENLRRLFEFRKVVSNRDECFKLIERDYPVTITKDQTFSDCRLLEGYFITPLERYLPGIVPKVAQKAHFQALLPIRWQDKGCKPVCLHLAGTGDHFFWRRRNLMAKPLLKEGIGGIILENPFYGLRKPTDQVRSSLHNVSDIFVMGGCLILESLVLFHWCERNGLGPLGVTGLSMGGHGVMSQSINWDLLEDQYLSDGIYREKLSKMVTIVDEAFLAGKKFARTYSHTVESNVQTNAQSKTIKSHDSPLKNVDITYKESNDNQPESNTVDVTNTAKENKKNKQEKSFAHQQNLKKELKLLLEENKISLVLYDKLTSEDKFELDVSDIEEINKMNEDKIKEVLLKYKVCEIRKVIIGKPPADQNVNEPEDQKLEMPLENIKNESVLQAQKTETDSSVDNNKTKNNNKNLVKVAEKQKKSWNVADLTADFLVNFPLWRSSGRKIDISKIHWRDREALQFMRGIMDECTHLSNFSVPYDTSLIIAVCAKHDAYVPRDDVGTLEEIWPGVEVRYVDAGHVSAYILHQSLFRSCIKEAFERSKKKWKDGRHID